MMTLFVYSLLSAACFFLFSRAAIAKPLWSRYPKWLNGLTSCAACSGFWYGMIIEFVFSMRRGHFVAREWLDLPHETTYLEMPIEALTVGLVTLVTTPIIAWVMDYAIYMLGTINPPDKPDPTATKHEDLL